MTSREAEQNILNMRRCESRRCFKRSCMGCGLYVPKEEKAKTLDVTYEILRSQKEQKREFFKSGIEYAKSEFARSIEAAKRNVDDLHKKGEINDFAYSQVLGLQKALELVDKITLNEELQEADRQYDRF